MALRFYIVPKIGSGTGPLTNAIRPKYLAALGLPLQAVDYGRFEDVFLVGIDLSPAQHTTVAANADVMAIPADLDLSIGAGAVANVQSRLELLKFPALWVDAQTPPRTILRVTLKMCRINQRFSGLHGHSFFEAGITLASIISSLTQVQRDKLKAMADSFKVDSSGVTGAMTVRQGLKLVADQLPSCTVMGETF